jgi:transcriptional regulator with XRE-family HTH domain
MVTYSRKPNCSEADSTPANTIGNAIRATRQAQGLSLKRAADLWGFQYPTISRWENGHHTPNRKSLKQLARHGVNLPADARRATDTHEERITRLESELEEMTGVLEDLERYVEILLAESEVSPVAGRDQTVRVEVRVIGPSDNPLALEG